MAQATRLLEALTKFYEVAGFWPTLCFLLALSAGPVVLTILRDRSAKRAVQEIINTKETEIQRLAKDNKEWRERFFRLMGLKEDEAKALEMPGQSTKPLVVQPVKKPELVPVAASRKRKGSR